MSATAMAEVEIESQALTTAERAKGLVVTNLQQRSVAAEVGLAIAGLVKKAEEFFKPMKEAAHKTHKEICKQESSVLDPLETARKHLSREIGEFDRRAEEERRKQELRLQQEAERQAAEEAQRIAAEVAIADAIDLEAEGDLAGAMAVLNNPVPVQSIAPVVIVRREIPKVEGLSTQQKWKFQITNPALVPDQYKIVDEKAIRGVVNALKEKTNIPGVTVYPEGAARFTA